MADTKKYLSFEGLSAFKAKIVELLDTKVDKVSGKGLSTNDYSDVEKAMVDASIKSFEVSGTRVTYTKNDNTTGYFDTKDTTYPKFKGATSAAAGEAGLVPAPSVDDRNKFLKGDGEWATVAQENTTYTFSAALNGNKLVVTVTPSEGDVKTFDVPAMTAASSSAAGKAGLVPAPGAGKQASFLRGDGTWVVPTDTKYSDATASTHGLMSAADKSKLDKFTDASDYALKSDIANVYKYKGSVATVADLPSTNQVAGDVYDVQERGINYAWNGTAWDPLGELFTINEITTAEINALFK